MYFEFGNSNVMENNLNLLVLLIKYILEDKNRGKKQFGDENL